MGRTGAWPWIWGGAAVALAGAVALVRWDIAQRREAFQADARAAHRLLSQRAAQHEAILATLALLGTAEAAPDHPEQRLPALYPQLLRVLRRDAATPWPDVALQDAENRSRAARRAELAALDANAGRYTLVQAGTPASFALVIDAQRLAPWGDWPIVRGGPVAVRLVQGAQTLVLQAGPEAAAQPGGLTPGFVFAKTLSAESQPFELQLQRATGPSQWPWAWLLAWTGAVALGTTGLAAWLRARRARRRAEELLRLSQVARLNALGEMAAGVAHELNQPLAAMAANAQAARRLLDEDPPVLDEARRALVAATGQARRAAEVVARLRRRVEAPDQAGALSPSSLQATARHVLDLLEPEIRRRGVTVELSGHCEPVLADPVALEQIVHNLVSNALYALDEVPAGERGLSVMLASEAGRGLLTVLDTGPGIAPDALPRLFEPFYTTRRDGLGLGLSLCESLAQAMNGTLSASSARPRGAQFRLALPLVTAKEPT
jgi:signal transduction histidine kinase